MPPLHANSCAGVTCSREGGIEKNNNKKLRQIVEWEFWLISSHTLQACTHSVKVLCLSLNLICISDFKWIHSWRFGCGSWIWDSKNWVLFWCIDFGLWCRGHCSCLTARRFQVWLGLSILCMGGFSLGNLVSSHRPETCTLGWLETRNCPLVWVCDWMECVL